MRRMVAEVRTSGSGDMLADRQTHTHGETDSLVTVLPTGARINIKLDIATDPS